MILCIDIGNTHIYAGLFVEHEIKLTVRYPSKYPCTSDIFGIFLRNALKENNFNYQDIDAISLCSVVPALDYSVIAACKKYLAIDPLELKPGIKTGLKIDIINPTEIGADRIANAVAAIHHFPNRNIIIVDFGTATTLCGVTKNKVYLGGAILPGFKISMEALAQQTAKLSIVDIIKPKDAIGRSTTTNIQAGLYYGQLGAVRELIAQFNAAAFKDEPAMVIATGGYAYLLEQEKIFAINIPDLVLHGLRIILEKNTATTEQ